MQNEIKKRAVFLFALTLLASLLPVSGAAPDLLKAKEKTLVLIFVSSECPISNKMAPEIERLHRKFSTNDVALTVVYPNASDSEKTIAAHQREYHLSAPFTRDPKHELVKAAGVTVTPEAVVFNAAREIVYRGRINDQYLALGKGRPAPTQHDLEEAIEATVAGKKPKESRTEAIGCYIQD